jgi:hypothetical protein
MWRFRIGKAAMFWFVEDTLDGRPFYWNAFRTWNGAVGYVNEEIDAMRRMKTL